MIEHRPPPSDDQVKEQLVAVLGHRGMHTHVIGRLDVPPLLELARVMAQEREHVEEVLVKLLFRRLSPRGILGAMTLKEWGQAWRNMDVDAHRAFIVQAIPAASRPARPA